MAFNNKTVTVQAHDNIKLDLNKLDLNALFPEPLLPTPLLMPDTPVSLPAHLGLTSRTLSGNHIIMWDFDDKTLDQVEKAVKTNWNFESAPTAYIVQSNIDAKHYHVYIFVEGKVASGHKAADSKHNAHSKELGFRTLRITPKNGFAPRVVKVIKGNEAIPETPLTELTTLVAYPMHSLGAPYQPHLPTVTHFDVSTHSLMQGVKFLQQLETAQKTKEVPSV